MASLASFIPKLQAIASGAYMAPLKLELARASRSLIETGFRTGSNPYQYGWEPLKYRNGRPLIKTGAMRNSFLCSPSARGILLVSLVAYAAVHQYGSLSKNIPRRSMLPTSAGGLGELWRSTFVQVFSKTMRAAVKNV